MNKTLNERRLDFLRKEFENKFCTVEGTASCKELSKRMSEYAKKSDKLYNHQFLSESTIMRLWGLIDSDKKYSMGRRKGSWSLIVRMLDYAGWDDFCEKFNFVDKPISNKLNPFEYLNLNEMIVLLEPNKLITIGFPPTKYSILKKNSYGEFEVIEEKGMHNRLGSILYIEKIILEQDAQNKNALPEIKYQYLACFDDENENGDIDESFYIPRLL